MHVVNRPGYRWQVGTRSSGAAAKDSRCDGARICGALGNSRRPRLYVSRIHLSSDTGSELNLRKTAGFSGNDNEFPVCIRNKSAEYDCPEAPTIVSTAVDRLPPVY